MHRIFGTLRRDMEVHLVKEEVFLFPAIGSGVDIAMLINELEAEHVGAGDALKQLREITDHYTVPQDGCASFREVCQLLQVFEQIFSATFIWKQYPIQKGTS